MAKLPHFRVMRAPDLALPCINFAMMALTAPNRPVHARKRHVKTLAEVYAFDIACTSRSSATAEIGEII
ncbi:MAG: hypothetical protein ACI9KK_001218 [Ascidiaceihabitans sp.]|jgi:hypothetical protein